jgi:polyferredoxin
MAEIRFICFSCGVEIITAQAPGRREECHKCGADLHVCRNCMFYDRTAYNECRESAAEVVKEKDRSNFCDFFSPRVAVSGLKTEAEKAQEIRAKAEALFKKK